MIEEGERVFSGVEAVIDKDRAAALLASRLEADKLIILTDVDGVYEHWGQADQALVREMKAADIDGTRFAAGSMGPKVEAAAFFTKFTGKSASIGSLSEALAVFEGKSGTLVTA